MIQKEILESALVTISEFIVKHGGEFRYKSKYGTLVITLINEEEEKQKLTKRIKKAQDSVPEL